MYCINCYTRIDPADELHQCPQCGRVFDPANPGTFLRRPFPGASRIISQIIGTTIVGVLVAFFVAMFQMVAFQAAGSGH